MRALASTGKHVLKHRLGPAVAARRPTRIDIPLDHWGLRIGGNDTLWLHDVDLSAVARQHGTPLHVVDGRRLEHACNDALAPFRAGHGADIFYSYKTNPVPAVLRRLHAGGIGAEVISAFELWLALQLGVPGDRIIYNGPAKSDESIRTAIEVGVRLVNANSLSELRRIIAIAGELRTPVNLGLRVSLPGMWGGQFGIVGHSAELDEAVALATSAPFAVLRGLHAHRGGTMRSEEAWRGHVLQVLHQCADLANRTGWRPEIVDLGGSLACPTTQPVPARDFRLNRALGTDLLPPDPMDAVSLRRASELAHDLVHDQLMPDPPSIVLEPGRALTSDSQLLLVAVVDVKDDVMPPHLVLDGGRNICDPLPHEYHQVISVDRPTAAATTSYRLVGPICTPADVVMYGWRLPAAERGDVLAIMDTGAYFVPFSTAFSFPRPGAVVIDDAGVTPARSHETFADLVRHDT